jgi:hypothetical protein
MSGYGVPPGSSPAASRSPRSGPAVPMLDLVGAGIAVLAFIFAFLPWAGPSVDVEGVDSQTASGWELALPTSATVLLLVAAALVVAPLLQSSRSTGEASAVPALLAVLAAILYLVYVIVGGKLLGTELERKIGVWLGLVAGLAAAGVLVFSWMQKSGRVTKKPTPAASYGPGGGGGQWGGQQGPSSYGQPPQQQPQGYGQGGYGQSGYPGSQPPPAQQPPSQSPGYGQGGYGQPGSPYGGGSASGSGPATGGTPAQGGGYGGGAGQDYPPASGYPSQGQGYPSQGGQSDYPR